MTDRMKLRIVFFTTPVVAILVVIFWPSQVKRDAENRQQCVQIRTVISRAESIYNSFPTGAVDTNMLAGALRELNQCASMLTGMPKKHGPIELTDELQDTKCRLTRLQEFCDHWAGCEACTGVKAAILCAQDWEAKTSVEAAKKGILEIEKAERLFDGVRAHNGQPYLYVQIKAARKKLEERIGK